MGNAYKEGNRHSVRICQRWCHISRNCNSAYNCVKCDQSHGPGECQRVRTESSDPYCINCVLSDHPANWQGCPSYTKYVKARGDWINKAKVVNAVAKDNVRRVVNASLITPGQTFSNLFQKSQIPQFKHKQKPSIIDAFFKLTEYFLKLNFCTFSTKLEPTMDNTYKK